MHHILPPPSHLRSSPPCIDPTVHSTALCCNPRRDLSVWPDRTDVVRNAIARSSGGLIMAHRSHPVMMTAATHWLWRLSCWRIPRTARSSSSTNIRALGGGTASPTRVRGLAQLPTRYDPAEVETTARYARWKPSFSPPADDAAKSPHGR